MSASNVCPNCGAANGPANLFCTNCGTRLAAAPPTETRVYPAAPSYPVPPSYPVAPAYPTVPPSMPPVAVPYPYVPGPSPWRVRFSTILSSMFKVWSENFLTFFVVFLVLALVNNLIAALLAYALLGTFEIGAGVLPGVPSAVLPSVSLWNLILFALLAVIEGIIINSIVVGGMTEYAVRRHRGEKMSLDRALRRGLEKFPSIFGAALLLGLLTFGLVLLPLLVLIPSISLGGPSSSAAIVAICGSLIGFVIGGIVALYVTIAMSLYAPAIMIEDTNAIGGLSRSWRLTKRRWWTLFGAFFVAGILVLLITLALILPVGIFRNTIASMIASSVASALVGAWFLILAAVAYDLLVRQPSAAAPTYYPAPPIAPPAGAAQTAQPPGTPPPPSP
ncbi:MAG: hypothetical protein E6J99_00920 [Methanobacteriota archaeon]|nr:MAG: hypothetical protein E6J99_00920 [Euryarchaeota archaeon]